MVSRARMSADAIGNHEEVSEECQSLSESTLGPPDRIAELIMDHSLGLT